MWSHLIYHSAGDENCTGIAAQDTANALAVLAQAVRGVAAGTKNARTQEYILSTAQQVSGCGHMGGCGHPVRSVAAAQQVRGVMLIRGFAASTPRMLIHRTISCPLPRVWSHGEGVGMLWLLVPRMLKHRLYILSTAQQVRGIMLES